MTKKPAEPKQILSNYKLSCGGIAATETATIIQLLQVPQLSQQLIIALYLFTFSLPLTVALFLLAMTKSFHFNERHEIRPKWIVIVLFFNSIIFILGLLFVVWHLNQIAAVIFLISIFFAIFVVIASGHPHL